MARYLNTDKVSQALIALLTAELPALLTAIPAAERVISVINTYGAGSPTWIEDDEFPTVRVNVRGTSRPGGIGRVISPSFDAIVTVAFRNRATTEAVQDGLRISDLCGQIVMNHDCYTYGGENVWRGLQRGTIAHQPAGSERWQGGQWGCTLDADEVTWT